MDRAVDCGSALYLVEKQRRQGSATNPFPSFVASMLFAGLALACLIRGIDILGTGAPAECPRVVRRAADPLLDARAEPDRLVLRRPGLHRTGHGGGAAAIL